MSALVMVSLKRVGVPANTLRTRVKCLEIFKLLLSDVKQYKNLQKSPRQTASLTIPTAAMRKVERIGEEERTRV